MMPWIRIAAVLLISLLMTTACQKSNTVSPLSPTASASAYGSLDVFVTAPENVAGVDLSRPDPDIPGYYALPGAHVSLVLASKDLGEILSTAEGAGKVSGADGTAHFAGLKCGVDFSIVVNAGGGACEKVDRKLNIPPGGALRCRAPVEGRNETVLTGMIDVVEQPRVFGPDDTLHFDWMVENPTGASVTAEWIVVAVNDPDNVLRRGTATTVAAGSGLVNLGIPLDLTGLPATNQSGQSAYKILCVVDGVVLGGDNFTIIGNRVADTPTPTATFTSTPTDTNTPTHTLTATPHGCLFLAKWGSYGSATGQFREPIECGVASDGTLWVSDFYNHRVQHFDADGNYLGQFGTYGTGNGQFVVPLGVDFDAAGNLYVVDSRNGRIQKFTSTGAYLAKWGSVGQGDGQMYGPWGVKVLGNRVYVSDEWNDRVVVFDTDGNFLFKWGTTGAGPGQFSGPHGIEQSPDGNLYVSDIWNHRIQKFTMDGEFLAAYGTQGSALGQFNQPQGIDVDAAGNLYVADDMNHRIQVLDRDMVPLTAWGTYGSGDCQFIRPSGIDIDPVRGVFYVNDSSNHRVQKLGAY